MTTLEELRPPGGWYRRDEQASPDPCPYCGQITGTVAGDGSGTPLPPLTPNELEHLTAPAGPIADELDAERRWATRSGSA